MRTFSPKPSDIQRAWHVVDANGLVLGRMATEVARLLRGKHKPIFAPHMDTGDHVIIVNAAKVVLTSDKAEKKEYIRHSGYPGGLKAIGYDRLASIEILTSLSVSRFIRSVKTSISPKTEAISAVVSGVPASSSPFGRERYI